MRIEFGPQLHERYKRQQLHLRAHEPQYYWTRGDYSGTDGSDPYPGITVFHMQPDYEPLTFQGPERKAVEEILGIEEHLCDRIATLITTKQDRTPVVCMDLGAMRALSWARLAMHFQQEVREGKVVFVSTSLSELTGPSAIRGERKNFSDLTKDEVNLLKEVEQQNLLQRIHGAVANFKRMHIRVGEKVLALRENVDILFESVAVTAWSKVPDLDILHASKLLSEYGTYYIREIDTQALQPIEGTGYSYREEQQRLRGIHIAFKQLERIYGLTRVYEAEDGRYKGVPLNYCVFRKPNAPIVKADN